MSTYSYRVVRSLSGAAVVMAVGLGGCTSGGPSASSASVPSSTVADTPTTTPPPMTSAVSDDAAAIAATAKYLESVNAAMRSRSSTRFVDAYWPGCVVCEQDASRIDSLAKKGHIATGGELVLTNPRVESREGADTVIVAADVTTDALTITDGGGNLVNSYATSSGLKRFLLIRRVGIWKVGGISS